MVACWASNKINYRETPLLSMYVFSGIAMVRVIFGGRTYFWGHDKTE